MYYKQSKIIKVKYIPSEYSIQVLSNYLRLNYTTEYVKSLTGLDDRNSRKVLYWLGQMYDEYEGINIKTITKIGEGVKAGLL